MPWLLEPSVLQALTQARESGFQPTAEQVASFSAIEKSDFKINSSTPGIAQIEITGILTPHRDILAMIFGGGNTTYPDIINAVQAADMSEKVTGVDLIFDSPGGSTNGMFMAMEAIAGVKKPVRAIVVNQATSAAYGLASQADEIIALNRAASFGSIGIAAQARIQKDVITITSTNAPNKRPDLETEEGKAVVRSELDEIENLFLEAIADGRKSDASTVIANFGKGATFLADEAMRRGMVDRIGLPGLPVKPKNRETIPLTRKAKTMNASDLKAENPALYNEVFALGQTTERKRVSAHLKLGKKFSAMEIAVKACSEGIDVSDPEVLADYMSAMADSRDLANAQADSDENEADDEKPEPTKPPVDADKAKDTAAASNIVKFAAQHLGIELEKGVAANG